MLFSIAILCCAEKTLSTCCHVNCGMPYRIGSNQHARCCCSTLFKLDILLCSSVSNQCLHCISACAHASLAALWPETVGANAEIGLHTLGALVARLLGLPIKPKLHFHFLLSPTVDYVQLQPAACKRHRLISICSTYKFLTGVMGLFMVDCAALSTG